MLSHLLRVVEERFWLPMDTEVTEVSSFDVEFETENLVDVQVVNQVYVPVERQLDDREID